MRTVTTVSRSATSPCRRPARIILWLACCLATEAGLEVLAPFHDAILAHVRQEDAEATVRLFARWKLIRQQRRSWRGLASRVPEPLRNSNVPLVPGFHRCLLR